MGIIDQAAAIFGLSIAPAKEKEDKLSAALSIPVDDEGAAYAAASTGSSYYGIYVDLDGAIKSDIEQIRRCREISMYPEIDIAIQDIVNEAIPQEKDSPQVELDLDDLDLSDGLKEKFIEEFKVVLSKLKYNENSADIFRRWYIDGRIYFQVIVDKENPRYGIQSINLIDATKIRKIKEVKKKRTELGVDVIDTVEEYFIYNEAGFATNANINQGASTATQGVKISPDSIVYGTSGYNDPNSGTVLSYLYKAVRPANQLRMMEDAVIVYRVARAPERRVFYIDVGTLPKLKAEQYIKEIMNRYRNKMVYDGKTGEVRDDKKYMSMLEDFWIPRRDGGKGTQIETLPGASNLNQLDDVLMFQEKLYQALNVPMSRIKPEQSGFNLGRSTEITRDEVKFQKFIDRLRTKFSQILYDLLKTQLILKGIANTEEWEDILRDQIRFKFQKDNYFSELKNLEMLQTRMAILPQVDQYLGKFFSKKYVQVHVLQMTEEDIKQMNDEIEKEKDDPTAQPAGMGGPPMQPGMGEDPYAQPPYGQPDQYQGEESPEGEGEDFPQGKGASFQAQ